MNTHNFGSTGEAYDACQCGIAEDNDLLVIESEQVVGVADTWPVAVTAKHGELHTPIKGVGLSELSAVSQDSVKAAVALAKEKGWATLPM